MKITCETNIVKRSTNDSKRRFKKSTLSIGKKDEKSKICLILVSTTFKAGIKYDLTNNIQNLFKKFIDQGKLTISFKLPDVDLQISADPIQLKAFFNVMKNELYPSEKAGTASGKVEDTKKINHLIRAFGSTTLPIEQVIEMTIKDRGSMPSKGFPRTLRKLRIVGLSLNQMPIGVLNLAHLTLLELTDNKISKLNSALGRLKIGTLILSNNILGSSENVKDWDWLNGDIRNHLTHLNMSHNGLKAIPIGVFHCLKLTTLDLSHNHIFKIPFMVKHLRYLDTLNLSHNRLRSLPHTIVKLRLSLIDLSTNDFPPESGLNSLVFYSFMVAKRMPIRVPTLLDAAARVITRRQIPYSGDRLPRILQDILFMSPTCANGRCDNFCFDMNVFSHINIIQVNARQRITSDNANTFSADGPYCSQDCIRTVHRRLFGTSMMA